MVQRFGGVARSAQAWSPIAMATQGVDMTEGGTAAVNFLEEAIAEDAQRAAQAQPTMPAAPTAPVDPVAYEERARAALAAMEANAAQQKKAASNPLNVAGSILGGVIGLPINFLRNALGGENNDLTAPFRPKQTAEGRYQATLAAIGDQRAKFEENLQQIRTSRANELKTALTSESELVDNVYSAAANLAANAAKSANPAATYAAGIANLSRNPVTGQYVSALGLDQMQWTPDLARSLAFGKDVASRLDSEAKPIVASTPENGVTTVIDPYTLKPKLIIRQGQVAAPTIGSPGRTVNGPPVVGSGITAPVNTRDYVNIPNGNPLDPNLGNTPNVRRPVAPVTPAAGPRAGVVEDGYRFKGGDPADRANWEKVN